MLDILWNNKTNSTNGLLDGQCNLVDVFGLFMQALIGIVAFSTLVLKRFKEPRKERRPWRIWIADTAKQALGMMMLHFLNIILSALLENKHDDQCVWYLTNFMLDSTFGLFFIYLFLLISKKIIQKLKFSPLISGEYGHPFKIHYWLGQLVVYLLVLLAVKVIMFLFALLPFWVILGNAILFFKNPLARTAVVMFVIPFIVNIIMFWIVDSVLMKSVNAVKQQTPHIIHYKKGEELESSEDSALISVV
ncbi:putative membrane protein [Oopsacas minuta]|uniref:Membrane protein n=1 Tax=Oopsacas minuta TaxID=111878 RepID=A0AAV7K8M7_9METZ|nr:putative membrane protein [Oopsacas minuta]